jgi:hypothetical protein
MDNQLYTNSGLLLSPCSFCNRKPGYFSNNINYCWVHWFDKDKNKILEKTNINSVHEIILPCNAING